MKTQTPTMISSHYIATSASWAECTPSSLSSAVTVLFDDDNIAESEDCLQEDQVQRLADVELRPQDDDPNSTPVTVQLCCKNDVNIASVVVVSNARHMEIYDDRGEYTCTVRGDKFAAVESQTMTYKKVSTLEGLLPSCSLKFLSLSEKHCLRVLRLIVRVRKVEQDKLILPKKQINMVKVRELLSTMSHPVPENVEHLMQTVEQYQENQSSVWSELQQKAEDTASRSSSSSAGPMAGMLSMLSRTGGFARMTSQVDGGANMDSNALTEVMSKMMTSFSGRHADAPDADNQLYQTLQGICRNVSQMRRDEKQQQARTDEREKSEKEAAGIEKDQPSFQGSERAAEILQDKMAAQLQALEERMMGRLERRLDAFEKHLELRLNRIEVIVEQLASSHRIRQVQNDGQHGYHGD